MPLASAVADDARLAMELKDEGDWLSSGIAYRRLALQAEEGDARAGYFWAAAHQYYRAGRYDDVPRLLDRAEAESFALDQQTSLLRGEAAYARQDFKQAVFFWEPLARTGEQEELQRYARRQLASAYLQQDDVERAVASLGDQDNQARQVIEWYASSPRKNPVLGGWLGLVPGLGYAYAGEYANALRSLILNSIFIYGMVDTARNDHWGGFAVITFFELTWYSGSIYGGLDASHRYNRRLLMDALERMEGDMAFEPAWEELPAVELRFRF
jgi:tetratricopeptide (TPR) repeat protein